MASFCLIGKRLNYSYSAIVHKNFGYDYDLTEVQPEDLEAFVKSRKYKGYNVTIPYKSEVMKYIDKISESAKLVGVVNLVVEEDGLLVGYNMDILGMEYAEKVAGINVTGKKVIILGTGNTSITAAALMKKLGAAEVVKISRESKTGDTYANISKHYDAEVIINTTPVGTYPDDESSLLSLAGFKNLIGVQEVIYNPFKTRLVLDAESRGLKVATGLDMLVGQAAFSAEKFVGTMPSMTKVRSIINKILADQTNIVLVGMPSSGKSTIGKEIARLTGKTFIDTDAIIETENGPITTIFEKNGEAYFRSIEEEVIARVGKERSQIIATGGGTIISERNRLNMKENGFIVYIKRNIDKLILDGRPLSQKLGVAKLYEERSALYESIADCIVDNNTTIENAVTQIMDAWRDKYENISD